METFQIFLRKNIQYILAGRMQDGVQLYLILPNPCSRWWCEPHLSFLSFFLTMWSSINTRCTPSLPNMVSALILVLLWKWNQIVMKHSWDSKSPKQWIQVWLMIITDFLGPMDCFTSSYPYLFTWNVTLYKILLWLKFDEIPSKVCHSPRTYHTHRKEVSQAFDPTLEEGIKR